jgi:hypothetical protein
MLRAALETGAADWIVHLHARGYDVVRLLDEGGALTALLGQCADGSWVKPSIKTLLELGVALHPGDLNLAVRFPLRHGILDLVLEKGPPTDGVLKDYGTPVQTVLGNILLPSKDTLTEHEKKLEMLIAAGCDVNLDSSEWKATSLQIVCARSMVFRDPVFPTFGVFVADKDNLASILLQAGAKVNVTVADIPSGARRLIRSSPLELACLTGKAEVVQALLDAGAEVNTAGGEFGPPLQAACMHLGKDAQTAWTLCGSWSPPGPMSMPSPRPAGRPSPRQHTHYSQK